MEHTRFLFYLDIALFTTVMVDWPVNVIGLPLHEWLGLMFAVLLVVHIVQQWRWLATTLRRVVLPAAWRGRINLALNVSLFVAMILLIFSGIMISQVALPAVGLRAPGSYAWLRFHNGVTDYAAALLGLHAALNWDWIAYTFKRYLIAPARRRGAEPAGAE